MNIPKKVSMNKYSSLRIGGEGDLIIVRNQKELVGACMYAETYNKTIFFLGEGTNTYFGEDLDSYLFIKNEIKGISFEEKNDNVFLTLGAGERMDDIIAFSVEKKLWGIENLSHIPGTVGAAPVQNIGAYGVELKDVIVSISAYDSKTKNTVEISQKACAFGYRDSLFKQEKNRYCILSVTLLLSKIPKPILSYKPLDTLTDKVDIDITDVRNLVIATRKMKLPKYEEYPNAGSFFKNPIISYKEGELLRKTYPGIPLILVGDMYKVGAAWLIEHIAEMKGVRVGDVGTWPNQPLVLVNYGQIQAEDINSFSKTLIQKIKERTGICLEREVNFVQ